MAVLLKCVTCGGAVSENAEKCPHCGEPSFVGWVAVGNPTLTLYPLLHCFIPHFRWVAQPFSFPNAVWECLSVKLRLTIRYSHLALTFGDEKMLSVLVYYRVIY
jgi:hypothetical protein